MSKIRTDAGLSTKRPTLGRRGSTLIGLIVILTIMASLGAGMVYLTTGSTFQEFFADRHIRAHCAAESGGRYAAALVRQAMATGNPDIETLSADYFSSEYTLANGDRFQIDNWSQSLVGGSMVVSFDSIGTTGSGFLQAARKLSFRMNPGSQELGGGPGGGNDVWVDFSAGSDPPFQQGANLGTFDISDGALTVTDVHNTHGAFLSIYETPDSVNLTADYDLQTKIRIADGAIHMAGLTFRKQTDLLDPGNRKSYGVSFLRGGGDTHPKFGDGIPDFGINTDNPDTTYIVLWEAPQGAPPSGGGDIIAWKAIPSTSEVLEDDGGVFKLKDWSTLLVRVREAVLPGGDRQNLISVYYGEDGTRTTGDADPLNDIRKSNPRDGLSEGGGSHLPWPADSMDAWSADVDYFTAVQWDWVQPEKATLSADGSYADVVVKTSQGEMSFSEPGFEFGFHAFGKDDIVTKVSFDDFAFQTGTGDGGYEDGDNTVVVSP